MAKQLPTLRRFASAPDPFEDLLLLRRRLRRSKTESLYLEWKVALPTGPSATRQLKYRTVKAVLSFANWEGGFILFGSDSSGTWVGLSQEDLAHFDPAKFTELVNGCVFPDVPRLEFQPMSWRDKNLIVLHVPSSDASPHITTKQIQVSREGRKPERILAKHALYCRRGGKSDLATPNQHHQIIQRVAQRVRDELVRRVKEVPVPVPDESAAGVGTGRGTIMVVRGDSDDSDATVVKVVRREDEAAGVLVHEELTEGLFEEVNNILDANDLLAGSHKSFVLGQPIYYRVYAERQHVVSSPTRITSLTRTALIREYGPFLYWVLRLDDSDLAQVFSEAVEKRKHPHIYGLMRFAVLLGQEVWDYLWRMIDNEWGQSTQPPDYYFTFKKIRKRNESDPILLALRTTAAATLDIPWRDQAVSHADLLDNTTLARKLLSEACMAVYEGHGDTTLARTLDVFAYGKAVSQRGVGFLSLVEGYAEED